MMDAGNRHTGRAAGRHTGDDAVNGTVFLDSEGVGGSHIADPQRDDAPLLAKRFELGGGWGLMIAPSKAVTL